MKQGSTSMAGILGVNVASVTSDDLFRLIDTTVQSRQKALVLNVNAHALNLSYELTWLRDYFNHAEMVFPDGYGAIWAGRTLGYHMHPRITYADWFYDLAAFAAGRRYSLFFLGGRPGVAEGARSVLLARHPRLRVLGALQGHFDHSRDSTDNRKVIKEINAAKPNLLVVGFGMPRQERWLLENWEELDANIALTGGAVFDYVSGMLKRPPRLLTDHGMEWLGRLLIEPGRLWRRYLLGNPKFVARVLRQWLKQTISGSRSA